jgi:hypothetical protein
MNSIGPCALAAYRVLTGVAILAFVGLLVFEARKYSFTWGAFGGVILLSLKGWFALIIGYRFLRQAASARIGAAVWRILGTGYCIIASAFLVAAISGEGWVYGLFATLVAIMAPVWFVLGWRAESDVARQTHSNSTTAGDAL